MNFKNIEALAKILNDSGLSAVEVKEGENTIRLEKNTVVSTSVAVNTPPAVNPQIEAKPADVKTAGAGEINFNNLMEFKAPLIGIFYSAPSPTEKPYVEIGSRIKKGDTLCIIEAMKLMNEITADRDGEIVDICVQNGQVVEYSQVLFKIY